MRRVITASGGSRFCRKWKWCTWVVSVGTLVLLALHSRAANAQTLTTLCSFNGSNGGYSFADLTLSGSMLYGTTYSGGDLSLNGGYGYGTVFSIATSGGTPTVACAKSVVSAVNQSGFEGRFCFATPHGGCPVA